MRSSSPSLASSAKLTRRVRFEPRPGVGRLSRTDRCRRVTGGDADGKARATTSSSTLLSLVSAAGGDAEISAVEGSLGPVKSDERFLDESPPDSSGGVTSSGGKSDLRGASDTDGGESTRVHVVGSGTATVAAVATAAGAMMINMKQNKFCKPYALSRELNFLK